MGIGLGRPEAQLSADVGGGGLEGEVEDVSKEVVDPCVKEVIQRDKVKKRAGKVLCDEGPGGRPAREGPSTTTTLRSCGGAVPRLCPGRQKRAVSAWGNPIQLIRGKRGGTTRWR